jgi:hypothetical protein
MGSASQPNRVDRGVLGQPPSKAPRANVTPVQQEKGKEKVVEKEEQIQQFSSNSEMGSASHPNRIDRGVLGQPPSKAPRANVTPVQQEKAKEKVVEKEEQMQQFSSNSEVGSASQPNRIDRGVLGQPPSKAPRANVTPVQQEKGKDKVVEKEEQMQQQQAAPQSTEYLDALAQILHRVQASFPHLTHNDAQIVARAVYAQQNGMPQSTQPQYAMQKPTQPHVESPEVLHTGAQVQLPQGTQDGFTPGATDPWSAEKTAASTVTSVAETHDGITGKEKDWRLPVGSWEDENAEIESVEKTKTGLIASLQWYAPRPKTLRPVLPADTQAGKTEETLAISSLLCTRSVPRRYASDSPPRKK